MYAVVRTGGKQYRVKEGDLLKVEKLSQDVGAKLELEVLLVGEGADVKLGAPLVGGAKVQAEVVSHGLVPEIGTREVESPAVAGHSRIGETGFELHSAGRRGGPGRHRRRGRQSQRGVVRPLARQKG